MAILIVVTTVAAAGAPPQIIDRMLAIVDGRVVTAEDLRKYRALAAVFDEQDLPESDAGLLARTIESRLVRAQVERVPGIRATEPDIDQFLARFPVPEALEFPLSPEALRQGARERIENQRYFSIRFPQSVSDAEIRDYYQNVWAPEAGQRGLDASLDEVEGVIEEIVILEKRQREAELWAETLVQRSQVEVVE